MDGVAPAPGLFERARALVGIVVIVALVGGAVALGVLVAAEVVSRTLETAVE